MRCPRLKDLPAPPSGKRGWPWTEESTCLADAWPKGREWPRITIVTPSFNQARFIEETVRSVLLQGYPDLEYFVLDGGSTDGSAEIIKKYSPWIDYWTSKPDGGQSAAINQGLRIGSGQFAGWLNSDDLLCRNAIVKQATVIQESGRVIPDSHTVYLGICLYINAEGSIISSHQGRIRSLEDLVRIGRVWRSGGHIVQPEVLFPRDLALEVGGLDPGNHCTMDYELWGKFFLAGAEFRYTDIEFAMFRTHPEQKTQDGLRQTRSLIGSAAKLVMQSTSLPDSAKDEILKDLHTYLIQYEEDHWRNSGRLARLRLPRAMVIWLREVKEFCRKGFPIDTQER
jgi:glycosyltransferase involved in cell wall biosynthesis